MKDSKKADYPSLTTGLEISFKLARARDTVFASSLLLHDSELRVAELFLSRAFKPTIMSQV